MRALQIRVSDSAKARDVVTRRLFVPVFDRQAFHFEDEFTAYFDKWAPAGARPPTFGVDYFCANSMQPLTVAF